MPVRSRAATEPATINSNPPEHLPYTASVKRRRSRPNNRARKAIITPDGFLEAVLDAEGDEATVLTTLEAHERELHAWMGKHPDAVQMARDALAERGVDISEPMLGWLRGDETIVSVPDNDENWAKYRDLLLEEQVLDERDVLERAKSKTAELVARLQAEKQARRQPKRAPDEGD